MSQKHGQIPPLHWPMFKTSLRAVALSVCLVESEPWQGLVQVVRQRIAAPAVITIRVGVGVAAICMCRLHRYAVAAALTSGAACRAQDLDEPAARKPKKVLPETFSTRVIRLSQSNRQRCACVHGRKHSNSGLLGFSLKGPGPGFASLVFV